jgi:hypothetical protein
VISLAFNERCDMVAATAVVQQDRPATIEGHLRQAQRAITKQLLANHIRRELLDALESYVVSRALRNSHTTLLKGKGRRHGRPKPAC